MFEPVTRYLPRYFKRDPAARSRWEVLNQQHEIVLSMEGWGMFRRRPTAEC